MVCNLYKLLPSALPAVAESKRRVSYTIALPVLRRSDEPWFGRVRARKVKPAAGRVRTTWVTPQRLQSF
jgi:hypothetical protein